MPDHRTPPPSTTLHIDWTLCDGRGLCTELLPEVLARDEWGYPLAQGSSGAPVPVSARSDVPITDALIPAARDAVALCPRQALRLTNSAKLARLPSNGRG